MKPKFEIGEMVYIKSVDEFAYVVDMDQASEHYPEGVLYFNEGWSCAKECIPNSVITETFKKMLMAGFE